MQPFPTMFNRISGIQVRNDKSAQHLENNPGKCEHRGVQSHPPLCNGRSTLDGCRRCAHARVQADSGLVSIKLVIGSEKDLVSILSRQK